MSSHTSLERENFSVQFHVMSRWPVLKPCGLRPFVLEGLIDDTVLQMVLNQESREISFQTCRRLYDVYSSSQQVNKPVPEGVLVHCTGHGAGAVAEPGICGWVCQVLKQIHNIMDDKL